MGSVQPFPGRPAAGTLADVWRLAALGSEPPRVRNTRREDYAAIRAVQRDASPHVPPWSLRQLEAQVHAFSPGQLVALAEGHVAGAAAALVVTWSDFGLEHTWRAVTAEGTFATHQPAGDTLYSAALVADTTRRGYGVTRMLMQAQRRLCRRMNLARIVTTARLAGYAAHAEGMAVEDYARRVVWGELEDAGLRFALAQGYQFCGIARDYMPEDGESKGHAAVLAWLNPLHARPQPPASIANERRRRAA
jgi:GNAT superfamily N-acetyltransferase